MWNRIHGYEFQGYALPADLQAWKASATKRTGSRLAEWKARLLQNFGDNGVLGRRLRFGQTQDEAQAAISQMTATALKEEAEVASRDGTLIGRLLHLGKSREAKDSTVFLSGSPLRPQVGLGLCAGRRFTEGDEITSYVAPPLLTFFYLEQLEGRDPSCADPLAPIDAPRGSTLAFYPPGEPAPSK